MDEERHDQPMEHRAEEEAGLRRGSAAFAASPTEDILMAWTKTVVRWSPIWVGFLVALGINLVLYVLSLAVALSTASPAATGSALARDVMQTATIWTAISSLVALFIGGFLAGRLGVQQGLRSGVTQGTVVWALFVIAMILFSLFGLGGLIGGAAGIAEVQPSAVGGAEVPMAEVQQMVSMTARSMWWLFAGLVISWLAAALGGYLGLKSAEPETAETR